MPTKNKSSSKAKAAGKTATKFSFKRLAQIRTAGVTASKKKVRFTEPSANPQREAALLAAVGKEPC